MLHLYRHLLVRVQKNINHNFGLGMLYFEIHKLFSFSISIYFYSQKDFCVKHYSTTELLFYDITVSLTVSR